MIVLALDTTSEAGGAAIFNDDVCLGRVVHKGGANEYSVALFEMAERLIDEARGRRDSPLRSQSDIDLYAVANGPGSFTGIRVGIAAVQAWARVFRKPAKGISVLEALVESAQPGTENSMAILNAYRGEFYVGEFRKSGDSGFVASSDGRVSCAEALKEFASKISGEVASWTCLVRAHDTPALALREVMPATIGWQVVKGPLLDAIARLGWRAALEGHVDAPERLDAYYIRRTDAELNWKE